MSSLRRLLGSLGIVAICAGWLTGGPVRADPAPSATEAVRATINEVIRILSDESLKAADRLKDRRAQLEAVIGRRFDYEEMSKRTLAAQWKKLGEAERTEFVELFKAFLSNVYGDKIEGYSGEQVEYLKERLEAPYAEVATRIVSDKLVLPMEYRLLLKTGEWRVYDVIADGISLVKNYRSQFEKVIREESYAALVEKLRKKSAEIKPPKTKG